jgi:membrane-associated phospholipid phosphatase
VEPNYEVYRTLLHRSVVVIAACGLAVIICYFFVDRPLAFFVHDHGIANFVEFRWLTEPPPIVQGWSPLVLVLLAIRRTFGPWHDWQHTLFVACVSLIVADQFRESIGDVCGRDWPETWHDNNPSLIGTGAYGFHFLELGDDTGSFPSGHSARILGFASVFWLAMPRCRWLYAIIALPMLVALVAMNYHFVGDVIAGSVLGAIIGVWATRLSWTGLTGSTRYDDDFVNDSFCEH